MALDLRLQMKLSQKLVMTQHLQLAIKLLQLNQLELQDRIAQELEENPLLEESQEISPLAELEAATAPPEDPAPPVENEDVVQLNEAADPMEEFDWEAALEDRADFDSSSYEQKEAFSYENILSKEESLQDHLLWQLSLSELDEKQQQIGYELIGNLDDRGYLNIELEDVAALHEVEVEAVEKVLYVVQRFDPPGVASRSIPECLCTQIDLLQKLDADEKDLACEMVEQHFHDLERKNYSEVARQMQVSTEDVLAVVEILRNLEPYPGRAWSTEPPHYIIPDVYIVKVDDDYQVLLNDDGMPRLRVSKMYRRLLKSKNETGKDTKEYVKDKMSSALWLIKSIEQRQRTIQKVANSILKFQREFFDKGLEYLKPLVLKDIAEDIQMHESTVSRASTNKYMHTPQGVFEIKYFFHSSIDTGHGASVSSHLIKSKLSKFVEAEDPRKPLSDQKLVEMFEAEKIQIARRTVAKYREELGIASSQQRKIR